MMFGFVVDLIMMIHGYHKYKSIWENLYPLMMIFCVSVKWKKLMTLTLLQLEKTLLVSELARLQQWDIFHENLFNMFDIH